MVYLWSVNESQMHVRLGHHTDYIKALAYASSANWVASGGLDRRIILWNIGENRGEMQGFDDREPWRLLSHDPLPSASIYALAANPAGNVLVSGSPEKVVKVWDPRSGKREIRLTGHTDNIRSVLVSDDGRWVISASSDTTIKLWSLAQPQRCMVTYTHAEDSIWCLYSNHPDLETFWSGGRDGWVTKMTRRRIGGDSTKGSKDQIIIPTSSIIRQPKPLLDDERSLRSYHFSLTSTDVPQQISISASSVAPATPPIHAATSMSLNANDWEIEDPPVEPVWKHPDHSIVGAPSIAKYTLLNDRRRVVSENTDGDVEVWDLVRCVRVKVFKKGGEVVARNDDADAEAEAKDRTLYESVIEAENTMEWIANWCSLDNKNGYISVHLDEAKCYDAEMYHEDTGCEYKPALEDQRINIGRWVLTHLFICYTHAMVNRVPAQALLYNDFYLGALTYTNRGAPPEETHMYIYGQEANYGPAIAVSNGHMVEDPVEEGDDHVVLGTYVAHEASSSGDPGILVNGGAAESVKASDPVEGETVGRDRPPTVGSASPDRHQENGNTSESEPRTSSDTNGTFSSDASSSSFAPGNLTPHLEEPPAPLLNLPPPPAGPPPQSARERFASGQSFGSVSILSLGASSHGGVTVPNSPDSTARAKPSPRTRKSSLPGAASGAEALMLANGTATGLMTKLRNSVKRRTPSRDPPETRLDADGASSEGGMVGGILVSGVHSNGTSGTTTPMLSVSPSLKKKQSLRGLGKWGKDKMSIASESSSGGGTVKSELSNGADGEAVMHRPTRAASEPLGAVSIPVATSATDSNSLPRPLIMLKGVHEGNGSNSSMSPNAFGDMRVLPSMNAEETAASIEATIRDLVLNPRPYTPNPEEIPPIRLPPSVPVILSIEESPEAGAFLEQIRSSVGALGWSREAARLEECIPKWVLDGISDSKTPVRDPAKMSFVLVPHPNSNLPDLPNNTSRLSSNRMLRIRKLLNYVVENIGLNPPVELVRQALVDAEQAAMVAADNVTRFGAGQEREEIRVQSIANLQALKICLNDSIVGPEKVQAEKVVRGLIKPERYFELCCNDKALPPKVTLATVKHHIWKSVGDLTLTYRRNYR
ncbi:hypothetical protein HK101_009000 [Irineochytrium annulatum]|nr:hypothetical protein HK101_009000 [Irineochytrium annulatum]